MSAFTILQDVTLLLRDELFGALSSAPGIDLGLTDALTNILLTAPGEDGENGVASLYLYHVELERHLRNQRPLPDREDPSLQRRPPLPLQLRYLLTPTTSTPTNDHLILGRVLQHFHDRPVVPVPGAPPRDSFGGASPELRVLPETPTVEQLTQVWNALNEPFRLSVVLLVEVVAIDSGLPPRVAPRVGGIHAAVGTLEGRP